MRFLAAFLAAAVVTAAADAHFVFVYVDGPDARLVFGHDAAPEPTLKQLKLDVDRRTGRTVLRLHPCNSEMPPVDFKDAADSIVGVKIGVVRYNAPKREPRREPGARRKK